MKETYKFVVKIRGYTIAKLKIVSFYLKIADVIERKKRYLYFKLQLIKFFRSESVKTVVC